MKACRSGVTATSNLSSEQSEQKREPVDRRGCPLFERVTVQASVSRPLGYSARNVTRKACARALRLKKVPGTRVLFRRAAVLSPRSTVSSPRSERLASIRPKERDSLIPMRRVALRKALSKASTHPRRERVNRRRTAQVCCQKPNRCE